MAAVGSFTIAAMANTQEIADAFVAEFAKMPDDYWYSSYLGNLYLLAMSGNMRTIGSPEAPSLGMDSRRDRGYVNCPLCPETNCHRPYNRSILMRTSRPLWIGSCSLLALIAAAGCGDARNGKPDAAVDARPVAPDSGPGVEAGPEAMREVTAEVDRDLALDTGIDAPADAPFPLLDGPAGYEVTVEVTGETKGPTPDTQGPDGAVLAPCTGDPTALIGSDPRYRCGNCGSDMVFPLVCQDGYLACAT